MDKRIGTYDSDGSVKEWPEQMLDGSSYNRFTTPPNIIRLNAQHFAVYAGSAMLQNAAVEALRATLGGTKAKAAVHEPARSGE